MLGFQAHSLFLFVCLFVCFGFGFLVVFFVFVFVFCFRDRVSLCSPSCPGTHSVDQAGFPNIYVCVCVCVFCVCVCVFSVCVCVCVCECFLCWALWLVHVKLMILAVLLKK